MTGGCWLWAGGVGLFCLFVCVSRVGVELSCLNSMDDRLQCSALWPTCLQCVQLWVMDQKNLSADSVVLVIGKWFWCFPGVNFFNRIFGSALNVIFADPL